MLWEAHPPALPLSRVSGGFRRSEKPGTPSREASHITATPFWVPKGITALETLGTSHRQDLEKHSQHFPLVFPKAA